MKRQRQTCGKMMSQPRSRPALYALAALCMFAGLVSGQVGPWSRSETEVPDVDIARFMSEYPWPLPSVYEGWKFRDEVTVSSSGTTLLSLTNGPGMALAIWLNVAETVDTTITGTTASALLRADSSNNLLRITITADGDSVVKNVPIADWLGTAEACSASAGKYFGKWEHYDSQGGLNAAVYDLWFFLSPISYQDSLRVTVYALGSGTYAPYLYWGIYGMRTQTYIEDYRYDYLYDTDTLGVRGIADLGGMTTDSTGLYGGVGSFRIWAETWQIDGSYDFPVRSGGLPGNASSSRFLEACVAEYLRGGPLVTTLLAAAAVGDASIKVNTDLTNWEFANESAVIVEHPWDKHLYRNHGSNVSTLSAGDSTISFPNAGDSLREAFSVGDPVIVFALDTSLYASGSLVMHEGIEEWKASSAYYMPGADPYRAGWPKYAGVLSWVDAEDKIGLAGVAGEPHSVYWTNIPAITGNWSDAVQTAHSYWVDNQNKAAAYDCFKIIRHGRHTYSTGRAGEHSSPLPVEPAYTTTTDTVDVRVAAADNGVGNTGTIGVDSWEDVCSGAVGTPALTGQTLRNYNIGDATYEVRLPCYGWDFTLSGVTVDPYAIEAATMRVYIKSSGLTAGSDSVRVYRVINDASPETVTTGWYTGQDRTALRFGGNKLDSTAIGAIAWADISGDAYHDIPIREFALADLVRYVSGTGWTASLCLVGEYQESLTAPTPSGELVQLNTGTVGDNPTQLILTQKVAQ